MLLLKYDRDEATPNQDPEQPIELPVERRRKRDILKRTFGIGANSSFTTENAQADNKSEAEQELAILQAGGSFSMPSFLTAQDEERLNASYQALKEDGMKRMMDDYNKGEFANVTLEEATKIVEYAVETEVSRWRDMQT